MHDAEPDFTTNNSYFLHCANAEHTLPTPPPMVRIAKSRAALGTTWIEELFVRLQQGSPDAEQARHELMQQIIDQADATNRVRSVACRYHRDQ